jgi:type IV fimbrial biogenesis protein FimT
MKSVNGFTLIELMVTIAVAAILLSIGIPAFNQMTATNRIASETNDLVSALNFARSEAVKRGATVSVCSSNNGTGCSGSWSDGWLVFVDADGDAAVDAGDTVVRAGEPKSGGTTWASGGGNITFQASGRANNTHTFTLTPSYCKGDMRRQVRLSLTGQVRTAAQSCP